MGLYKYFFSLDTVFSLAKVKVPGGHQKCFFCSPQTAHHSEHIVLAQEMLTDYEVLTIFLPLNIFRNANYSTNCSVLEAKRKQSSVSIHFALAMH